MQYGLTVTWGPAPGTLLVAGYETVVPRRRAVVFTTRTSVMRIRYGSQHRRPRDTDLRTERDGGRAEPSFYNQCGTGGSGAVRRFLRRMAYVDAYTPYFLHHHTSSTCNGSSDRVQ